MRRSLLSAASLLTAFAMPLVAVAPASATSPDLSTVTFDCSTYIPVPYEQDIALYEASVTLTFENCTGDYYLADLDDTGNASTGADTLDSLGAEDSPNQIVLDTVTVTGGVTVSLYDSERNWFAGFNFIEPHELPNPTGTQLADSSQFLPADAPSTTWGTPSQINNNDEITVDNVDGCEINAGEHVYATQSFTVLTPGEFTFRVTGVDPVSHYFRNFGFDGSELDDPMVALYSTFNTRDTDSNVVGCNDDLNDLVFGGHDYDDNDFNVTAQGDYVEGHFSYFSTTLEPGDYMLVFTTWDNVSADEWAEETPNGGTVYFDVWGPNAGLSLTDVDPISEVATDGTGALASTGVEPTFALWSALFLIGSGAVMMVTRRNRRVLTRQ